MLSSHDWFCISAILRQKNVMRCSGKGSLWLISLYLQAVQSGTSVEYLVIHKKDRVRVRFISRLRASFVHGLCRDMHLEKLEWRWVKGTERSRCQMKHSKEMCYNKHLIDLQLCSLESAMDSENAWKTSLNGFKFQRSIGFMLPNVYSAVSIVLYHRNLQLSFPVVLALKKVLFWERASR